MTVETEQDLQRALWKGLGDDRTVMLGLGGAERGHLRPMTAQVEGDSGPLWFFTATDNALVRELDRGDGAVVAYVAKDHDLFASIEGRLALDQDRATIDRLWNPFAAAWYEGGKDDPRLALLRFDPAHAEIWRNTGSLLAGIRILLGGDPKQDARDNVAHVNLH
ncbi:pyridoxamine 5'-phosphate oxidase family protein [Cognatiluteimonas telluris]|uniref:pyridoxamine 5'-phosphate oxidase family protein n=1 Tax=Cognatiluteimonas telluris TaxID=1104775 RepID=UPI0014081230|nr:pyridoxamine 5'-phosphate oxidase family protein [Lysobacter telluris]